MLIETIALYLVEGVHIGGPFIINFWFQQPEPTVQEATQFSKEDSLASTTSLQGPQSVEPSGSASAATSTEKSGQNVT